MFTTVWALDQASLGLKCSNTFPFLLKPIWFRVSYLFFFFLATNHILIETTDLFGDFLSCFLEGFETQIYMDTSAKRKKNLIYLKDTMNKKVNFKWL